MALEHLLQQWRKDRSVAEQITAWEISPARNAVLSAIPAELDPALAKGLGEMGIRGLYSHQKEAWEQTNAGKSVLLATGTASGKSIGYNLPVIQTLLEDSHATALYLFPTKALTQDQLKAVRSLVRNIDTAGTDLEELIPTAIFDGDTPSSARMKVRNTARVLFTNPDMLHIGILPNHTKWERFFAGLRWIVLDEVHIYRGVFGSHVANVLRRLRRIARFYGAKPRFLLTSATIANPEELASRLCEEEVVVIDKDGSGHGEKHFLIYNPPIVDPNLGLRRGVLQEAQLLADDLLAHKVQALIFARSRRSVEILLRYLRERNEGIHQGETFRGYRSGYLAGQRRRIEKSLRNQEAKVVVATNALELGIDIGGLDSVLMAGYPGSITSTWQQAGRAGRKENVSLAMLITSAAPIDQFLAKHPEYFFKRTPERALINPDHLLLLFHHLQCALYELPFLAGESFGTLDSASLGELLEVMAEQNLAHRKNERTVWVGDAYPAQQISLRSTGTAPVFIQADGRTVGEVEAAGAPWMVHPGAIYLHEGHSYRVENLDLENRVATVEAADVDYYTEPKNQTDISLVEEKQSAQVKGGRISHGDLEVKSQVVGYRKTQWYSLENLGFEPLDMPPNELHTSGFWLALADAALSELREEGAWSNDPNEYGKEWEELRKSIRERDNYECQLCGAPENGKAHHVHHKTPFRSFNNKKAANSPENLITLCPTCHKKVETSVRVRSGLAGLGYVLGNLAPLFLMCDSADLGTQSDPRCIFTGGLPTVIIYERIPAGIGFSEELYKLHSRLIDSAHELVAGCECNDGCPSCTGPGGENGSGGKKETLAILNKLR